MSASLKRALAALAGVVAFTAAFLRLRRRRRGDEIEAEADSPADELRARLDEARAAAEAEPSEAASAEPATAESPVEEPPVEESSVAARRRDVHDRARDAIDELT